MERAAASARTSYLLLSAVLLASAYVAFQSCSEDGIELRDIAAHTTLYKGVQHAQPSLRAERYCQECHGVNLQGGSAFEPSCYSCHGKNWLDDDPQLSLAPADHTVEQAGSQTPYRHHPDLLNPEATCAACHGLHLEGSFEVGGTHPPCELCHSRLWERGL